MSLRWLMDWLDNTGWSTALHESLYAYPLIETTHVLSLTLFVGMLIMVDLRLLGVAFRATAVSALTQRVLPFAVVGFVFMTVTGLLLFYAIPVRTYHSIWFRMKVAMIVFAGINAWYFHRKLNRARVIWDRDPTPPLAVRVSSGLSILLWFGVIICGRMIAYNWFDCDRPQPDWVVTLAGCTPDMLFVP